MLISIKENNMVQLISYFIQKELCKHIDLEVKELVTSHLYFHLFHLYLKSLNKKFQEQSYYLINLYGK